MPPFLRVQKFFPIGGLHLIFLIPHACRRELKYMRALSERRSFRIRGLSKPWGRYIFRIGGIFLQFIWEFPASVAWRKFFAACSAPFCHRLGAYGI